MKIYALIITDADMRPASDVTTVALFTTRRAAEKAMMQDIDGAIENEQISRAEISGSAKDGFACSADGRFSWKIECRSVAERGLALKLAKAVNAWADIDECVADQGWTKENEGVWDDRRNAMLDLTDRIYKVNGLKRKLHGE